jgi:hypothetical protein
MLSDAVGWCWRHADQRHLIAHDDRSINDGCASARRYPLAFRRFRKREACKAAGTAFASHPDLARQLVDRVIEHAFPGTCTFDSAFSKVELLQHIHRARRVYVGNMQCIDYPAAPRARRLWISQAAPKNVVQVSTIAAPEATSA